VRENKIGAQMLVAWLKVLDKFEFFWAQINLLVLRWQFVQFYIFSKVAFICACWSSVSSGFTASGELNLQLGHLGR
jgi:hypothetical protein